MMVRNRKQLEGVDDFSIKINPNNFYVCIYIYTQVITLTLQPYFQCLIWCSTEIVGIAHLAFHRKKEQEPFI